MEETTNYRIQQLREEQFKIESEIKTLLEKQTDRFSIYMHHGDDVCEQLRDTFPNISDEKLDAMVDVANQALYEIECVFQYNPETKKYYLSTIESRDKTILVNSNLIDIT